MSKKMKIWLIIAASLVVAGGLLYSGALWMADWDITKLGTVEYEVNNYEFTEAVTDITVTTGGDLIFRPAADGKLSIECKEDVKEKHTVTVTDGHLQILRKKEKPWYADVGINFESTRIVVSLPEEVYGKLTVSASTGDVEIGKEFQFASMDVKVSTGDIKNYAAAAGMVKLTTSTGGIYMKNISVGELELEVSTGDIEAETVACQGQTNIHTSSGEVKLTDFTSNGFWVKGSTSDLYFKKLMVAGRMEIKTSTGAVEFDHCDAGEMKVTTSTGDVTGSLLSDKIFVVETSTGDVDVPRCHTGDICEITTSTGDVEITIP